LGVKALKLEALSTKSPFFYHEEIFTLQESVNYKMKDAQLSFISLKGKNRIAGGLNHRYDILAVFKPRRGGVIFSTTL
jgi:hypothetical protein